MTQASFFCTKYELSEDISERVIEPVDFDREVIFIRGSLSPAAIAFGFLQFTPTGGSGVKDFSVWEPGDTDEQLRFVLPAGQELWTGTTDPGTTLSFVVAKL